MALLQALDDQGRDLADVGHDLVREVRNPPLEGSAWQAVKTWLDAAVESSPTYHEMVRIRRAALDLLDSQHRAARWATDHRQAVERKQAELEARAAGTYWRDRDARRTATRPIHIAIDDDTWAQFQAWSTSRGRSLGESVGALVADATPQQMAEGLPFAIPTKRFLRIVIDEQSWCSFRGLASRSRLSGSEAVGRLIVSTVARERQ